MKVLDRLPYAAALGIMCAVIVLGIFVDVRYRVPLALYAAIGAVVVFGALFMIDYSRRTLVEPAPRPAAPPPALAADAPPSPSKPPAPPEPFLDPKDESTFVDPVIEADQLATGEVLPNVVEEGGSNEGSADESPGAPP